MNKKFSQRINQLNEINKDNKIKNKKLELKKKDLLEKLEQAGNIIRQNEKKIRKRW